MKIDGVITDISRTHADGTVRLAREIPYGSLAWEKHYHHRNSSETRNSVQEQLGLKRLPVHCAGLLRGSPQFTTPVLPHPRPAAKANE
jgi:hypothetical protein